MRLQVPKQPFAFAFGPKHFLHKTCSGFSVRMVPYIWQHHPFYKLCQLCQISSFNMWEIQCAARGCKPFWYNGANCRGTRANHSQRRALRRWHPTRGQFCSVPQQGFAQIVVKQNIETNLPQQTAPGDRLNQANYGPRPSRARPIALEPVTLGVFWTSRRGCHKGNRDSSAWKKTPCYYKVYIYLCLYIWIYICIRVSYKYSWQTKAGNFNKNHPGKRAPCWLSCLFCVVIELTLDWTTSWQPYLVTELFTTEIFLRHQRQSSQHNRDQVISATRGIRSQKRLGVPGGPSARSSSSRSSNISRFRMKMLGEALCSYHFLGQTPHACAQGACVCVCVCVQWLFLLHHPEGWGTLS